MKKAIILMIATICLCPILAFAADEITIGPALADVATGVLFPLLNAVLVILIGWAVAYIGKKYKIDALAGYQSLIQEAAYKGISLAEEYAAKRLKTSKIKLGSSEKLNIAVGQVLAAAPRLTREQATDYVESLLGRLRGVGATGDAAVR